mgnify:CR=1 FL=1
MQKLGKHEMSIEGNAVHLVSHGSISLSEMEELLTTLHGIHAQHGQSYLIADVSRGITLAAEVRKYIATYTKRTGYTSTQTYVVGAGSVTRALVALVTRTIELLSGPKSNLSFVSSVQIAKALIAELTATAAGGK